MGASKLTANERAVRKRVAARIRQQRCRARKREQQREATKKSGPEAGGSETATFCMQRVVSFESFHSRELSESRTAPTTCDSARTPFMGSVAPPIPSSAFSAKQLRANESPSHAMFAASFPLSWTTSFEELRHMPSPTKASVSEQQLPTHPAAPVTPLCSVEMTAISAMLSLSKDDSPVHTRRSVRDSTLFAAVPLPPFLPSHDQNTTRSNDPSPTLAPHAVAAPVLVGNCEKALTKKLRRSQSITNNKQRANSGLFLCLR